MAGFRMGRGQDPRTAQQNGTPPAYPNHGPAQPGQPGQYGRGGAPQQQWTSEEPEYFGGEQHSPHPHSPRHHQAPPPHDAPGHTVAFRVGEFPDGGGRPGDDQDGYDNASTYRSGDRPSGPPPGPRLHWKALLSGIVLRPGDTFWRMRDHQMWATALLVTFVYGLVAVFGFGEEARDEVLNATLSNSIPWVLMAGVAVVISYLMLGAVTNALARQFGGDGLWAPTIGLSMLITVITDAPRLLFAIFMPVDSAFVQVLGWGTWLACGALLTSMVSKSHDLPWPRALGACAVQLLGLLVLIKLPTIGS
ncbi:YIP1 family protein [Streptomyces sp. NPDC059506]|uniref:Yip1 family protein n=1 Tax=Streptomyces sp. NPDC059506 TaxID=3347751 RepID=UPI00369E81FE